MYYTRSPPPPSSLSLLSPVIDLLFSWNAFGNAHEQEGLLERVESAFTLFRQHGGKARRQRKVHTLVYFSDLEKKVSTYWSSHLPPGKAPPSR